MKRKGILEFMKNCILDVDFNFVITNSKSVMKTIRDLNKDLHMHYCFMDIEKQSNHHQRFYLLYIDNNHMTFSAMADATFVSIDTFKEYVRFYNNTALEYVISQSKNNSEYALLLREYHRSIKQ